MKNCGHALWPQDECYVCKVKPLIKVPLADGCQVPVCGDCLKIYETGKKMAEETSRYDTNRIRGGDKMKVEKGNIGGNHLKVEFIAEKKITALEIADEGEMITYDPKSENDKPTTKLVIGVKYEGKTDDDPDRWSMNNKSRNALIDAWGFDTKDWIGKKAEIAISGEGEYKHITVDTLRTK